MLCRSRVTRIDEAIQLTTILLLLLGRHSGTLKYLARHIWDQPPTTRSRDRHRGAVHSQIFMINMRMVCMRWRETHLQSLFSLEQTPVSRVRQGYQMDLVAVYRLLGKCRPMACSVVCLCRAMHRGSHRILIQETGAKHRRFTELIQTNLHIQNHHRIS